MWNKSGGKIVPNKLSELLLHNVIREAIGPDRVYMIMGPFGKINKLIIFRFFFCALLLVHFMVTLHKIIIFNIFLFVIILVTFPANFLCVGLNLRNVAFHGFVTPHEWHSCYTSFLLFLMLDLTECLRPWLVPRALLNLNEILAGKPFAQHLSIFDGKVSDNLTGN